MIKNYALLCLLSCIALTPSIANTFAEKPLNKTKPLKVLLVTGGSSHDYTAQKVILSQGITKRANVVFTIAHQGGKNRNKKIDTFSSPNWAKKYDIIVHNICFGGVTDVKFVEQVAQAHKNGTPAVVIHCSMHSFRHAKTDAWRKTVGVSSFSHERHRPLDVKNINPKHPIMINFPKVWKTPNGELYKIAKTWPNCKPLATAYGKDTKKDHTCIWTNTYGKGRIFATTLGHHNETMKQDIYLDLVTRGLLWACDKLDKNGKPKPGFGPITKTTKTSKAK